MKTRLILVLAAVLPSCSNLTPEQNTALLKAGIGIGKEIVRHHLEAPADSGK